MVLFFLFIQLSKFQKFIKNRFLLLKIILIIIFSIFAVICKTKISIIIKPNLDSIDFTLINQTFFNLVQKYKYLINYEKTLPDESPIWVMWYQGINNAPLIIKACINSIIMNAEKHPVFILDKNNYYKYVTLPYYILKKFQKGLFDITHFSDIIRMALLSNYGGYWIDSTYLINSPLKPINSSLFTLKLSSDGCFITKCLWAGNFIAITKNSFLATYAYNAFLFYWKNYNYLIHYFLIDYIIQVAYENEPKLRKMIINLPYVNCNIFQILDSLDNEYNNNTLFCNFNKLTWKKNWDLYNNTTKTIYKYIINNYKNNF